MKKIAGIFVLLWIWLSGCTSVSGPEKKELPALMDSIPFDSLGSGIIAFHRIGPGNPPEYEAIYVIDLDQKSSWGFYGPAAQAPHLSPDGRAIAFTMRRDPITSRDVYLMDIYGQILINASLMRGEEFFPTWAPDMSAIYYWNFSGGVPILFMQDPSNNYYSQVPLLVFSVRVEGENIIIIPTGGISVSGSGDIYFCSNSFPEKGLNGIYLLKKNDEFVEQIYHPAGFLQVESPVISPDGQTLAFLEIDRDSSYTYHSMDIRLMDLVSGEATTIFHTSLQGANEWIIYGKNNPHSLNWSPDGTKILFSKPEGDLVSHIFLIRRDGTGLTRVTSLAGAFDVSPSWSRSWK